MRISWLLLLAATVLGTSTLAGQGPGGRRGGGMGGGRAGGHGFDPSALPSPSEVDGPPTPGTFKQLFALTDPQVDQYSHGWDSLMAETTPQRDSARVARQTMRAAFQDHDREAAQQQAKLLERLGKDLRKRDQTFDKSLSFLTADQRKQYDNWKKEEKKAEDEQRQQRFRGNNADGPPGSS